MNTQLLHEQVWKRFIRMPYGHLLDYADQNGRTALPTAAELQANLPNPLAWGTSIENGAFFGGLYLYGLCEKYDLSPDQRLKDEIKLLADGLLLLCDVCVQDGCIARGVGDDGVSHPPFSSEDQLGPWLLGLWRLFCSPASDERMRSEIKKRLVRTLAGVRRAQWKIPTEWEGEPCGSYARKDWRGASKLLFAAAVARQVGVLDQGEFEQLATEHPDGGIYSRPEIVSHGFGPDMIRNTGLIQFWIYACAQLCVRELCTLDAPREEYYRRGLAVNGASVVEFFREYENYLPLAGEPLSYDWRVLLEDVHPWSTKAEAVEEAGRQIRTFFSEHSPRMRFEKKFLGPTLFACWIAVASGDKAAAGLAYERLGEMTQRIKWADCGYCFAFAAEAAIYCYQNREKK